MLNNPIQIEIFENSFKPESYIDFQAVYSSDNLLITFSTLERIGMSKYREIFLKWLTHCIQLIKWFPKDELDYSKAIKILKDNQMEIIHFGHGYSIRHLKHWRSDEPKRI